MLSNFLFWSLLTSVASGSVELCSQAELRSANQAHDTCLSTMKSNLMQFIAVFQQSTHLFTNSDELCQIINEAVFGCGKEYEKCFNQDEIQ